MYEDTSYHRTLAVVGAAAEPVVRLHATLDTLLPAMADHEHYIPLKRYGGIAPERILTLPWSPRRLAECRQRLAAGTKPPPITVTRIRLPRVVWYLVSDGTHRAWAAREAGVRRIGAYIDSEVPCRPEQFRLAQRYGRWELWQQHPLGWALVGDAPSVWFPVAQALGVALDPN
jgi:hypothetical protein